METLFDVGFDINFELAPPCEHSEHEGNEAAAYLIRSTCPGCPDAGTLLICNPCYKLGLECVLECDFCGYIGDALQMWRVIQIL